MRLRSARRNTLLSHQQNSFPIMAKTFFGVELKGVVVHICESNNASLNPKP
jgi:hypothetical protein